MSITTTEQAKLYGSLGGRPKGSKNKLTIAKEKAREELARQAVGFATALQLSQAKIAMGTYKVCIMKMIAGQRTYEQVTDEKKVDKLLKSGVAGKDYFIFELSAGSWQAANAVLDRTFGKAKEHVQVDGDIKFSLVDLARQADERERAESQGIVIDVNSKNVEE